MKTTTTNSDDVTLSADVRARLAGGLVALAAVPQRGNRARLPVGRPAVHGELREQVRDWIREAVQRCANDVMVTNTLFLGLTGAEPHGRQCKVGEAGPSWETLRGWVRAQRKGSEGGGR